MAARRPEPLRDPARELARLLSDAVARLEDVSASLGVGSVTRPSVPADVVRFIEGRWAALREVDRLAALDGVPAALVSIRREWLLDTAAPARTSSAQPGAAAYRQGGLDALDDLAARLRA